MNLYEKVLTIRKEFLETKPRKTGANTNGVGYEYFTLEDIVPQAYPLFTKYGILPITTVNRPVTEGGQAEASLTLIDSESADKIVFSIPFVVQDSIVSRQGRAVTNAVQNTGSSVTYYRRYLYMLALDIVDVDKIEECAGNEPHPPKAPVTIEKRAEIKDSVVSPTSVAPAPMVKTLKKLLEDLKEVDKDLTVTIVKKIKTTPELSKSDCEKLILAARTRLNDMKESA